MLGHTRDVVFLGDEEMAVITRSTVEFTDFDGRAVSKATERVQWDPVMAEKAGYKHFMLKEIFEQPRAVQETVLGRVSEERGTVHLGEVDISHDELRRIEQVVILACGTSWHAGLVGKFLIEQLAKLRVDVDYGSEYRYRDPLADSRTLTVVITQSGETADTLAALREAQGKGATSIAICNVVGSMATRDADGTIYTHAGPEIGVASTKAFTAQLVALNLLALYLAQVRGTLASDEAQRQIEGLTQLPGLLQHTLRCDTAVAGIAKRFYRRSNFFVSRAWYQLSHRARGRPQAQGDLIYPRRRLSGGGDEAWAHRADRREHAGRRSGPKRTGIRKDDGQPARGQDPRRGDPCRDRCRPGGVQRHSRSGSGLCHPGSPRTSVAQPTPHGGSTSAPCLPHRRPARM